MTQVDCSGQCRDEWVELEWEELAPDERASGCPPDTRTVPYLARVRGMAAAPTVGDDTEVRTPTGRLIRGRVRELDPGYEHSFGHPLPAWVHMKNHIRDLLKAAPGPTPKAPS